VQADARDEKSATPCLRRNSSTVLRKKSEGQQQKPKREKTGNPKNEKHQCTRKETTYGRHLAFREDTLAKAPTTVHLCKREWAMGTAGENGA
jgi:hypothetical protein